jgi:hypothetical protein
MTGTSLSLSLSALSVDLVEIVLVLFELLLLERFLNANLLSEDS